MLFCFLISKRHVSPLGIKRDGFFLINPGKKFKALGLGKAVLDFSKEPGTKTDALIVGMDNQTFHKTCVFLDNLTADTSNDLVFICGSKKNIVGNGVYNFILRFK